MGIVVYTTPSFDNDMIIQVPSDADNIHYVIKEPSVGRIFTYVDKSAPKCEFYNANGEILSEKQISDKLIYEKLVSDKKEANSIDVKSGPIKGKGKSSVWIRHKKIKPTIKYGSLRQLVNKITKTDYDEAEKDASYIRGDEKKELIRVPLRNYYQSNKNI
jgi:hypothetical protein